MTPDTGPEVLESVLGPHSEGANASAPLSRAAAADIWDRWLRMWNVEPQTAAEIIGPGYRVHLPSVGATVDADAIRDAEGMARWVSSFREKFDGLHYRTERGPFVDGDTLICRWVGRAVFRGRTNWSSDVSGAPVTWVGVDILRIAGGRIVEAWTQGAETTKA
ncbi:MAG TPA: nuclear transport factor 2 family protein [Kineosporiaceae bacterium]|nr:nuclear transport factor 2 family protein [Kineosporiaceae bacterium]